MNGWQAIVTPDTGGVPTGVTSSKPGDGHARYELVLNIQRELKRAGCYGGTLSGSWNANTKRAMGSFMERVNATLPIDEPDYILLTLIKGQAAASCVTCPLGQSSRMAAACRTPSSPRRNRRNPMGAGSKPQRSPTVWLHNDNGDRRSRYDVDDGRRAPSAALPGRMSMGGPRSSPASCCAGHRKLEGQDHPDAGETSTGLKCRRSADILDCAQRVAAGAPSSRSRPDPAAPRRRRRRCSKTKRRPRCSARRRTC